MNDIIHYDLFAGIGGFSLAIDNIYGKQNTKHIFIERDEFCQQVLKKHWPEAEYWGDINEFIANTNSPRFQTEGSEQQTAGATREITLLTGGFPCQPFSQAGRRKGTADDRYLWPAMFESIRLIRPDWIIGENVAGLITWNEGMVLEQVCSDLEKEGYEVQPFIIPACAVNAPHRRDRVWIVANINSEGLQRDRQSGSQIERQFRLQNRERNEERRDCWRRNWLEVATEFCRMDARISYWVDGRGKKRDARSQRLKALGNAIVPQVAEMIIKQIKWGYYNEFREI